MHFITLRHLFIPIPDLSDLTQQTGMFFLCSGISEEPDCNTHTTEISCNRLCPRLANKKTKSRLRKFGKLLGKNSLKSQYQVGNGKNIRKPADNQL